MRHLFLLQGVPGSGKSTFIERHGLGGHTVSSDALRLLFRGPEQAQAGHDTISIQSDFAVWRTLTEMVSERLRHGDLTVVDATHTRRREIEQYAELAAMHRYRTYIVSWRGLALEDCLARNAGRAPLRRVPDLAVTEMHARLEGFQAPSWIERTIAPEGFAALTRDPVLDGSRYRALHVIGDLQGCAAPLAQYLEGGLKEDELYVFVGDLLDRGIENAEVMRLMLPLAQRPNVVICEGNHERHLRNWAAGIPAVSRLFENKTRVELEDGKIERDATKALLARLVDAVLVDWRGQRILVSHGGLARMPDEDRLAFVPSLQLIKGVGPHDFDVDGAFAAASRPGMIQVHGHRNEKRLPVAAAPGSYNLEGRVEFGGALRIVRFEEGGTVTPIEIANARYDVRTALTDDEETLKRTSKRLAGLSVQDMVLAMRENPHVIEKALPSGISSFNFSREAFQEGIWDAQTIRARGLFVDVQAMEIVARSYDKFFNLGENEPSSMPSLARKLRFPARVWVKENGYLGIVGFDKAKDQIVYASKSTTEKEYAGWVKEILHDVMQVDATKLRKILARGFSLVFEVIDPINDPHLIKYAERRLVLLDAVRNEVEFKALPYDQLVGIGQHLGVPVKRRHCVLESYDDLARFVNATASPAGYLVEGEHVEGFVIEDSAGFMVKIKLPYYSMWKRLRTCAEQVARGKDVRGFDQLPERAQRFLQWLRQRPDLWGQGIIALRDAFEASKAHADAEPA